MQKTFFFLEEDNKDVTLLHIACHFGIVHYLITKMRCIPRYDVTQNQDLHCACLGGNLEVVKEVAKCMTAWYQSSGATPLHLACKGCHTETVKYLISEMKCNTTIQPLSSQICMLSKGILPATYITY